MAGVHDLDNVKLDLDDQPIDLINSTNSHQNRSQARLNSNRVNTKLEYHLTIAKTVKGASAVKLIKDSLSSKGVYVFGELLNLPGISELATHPTHSTYHQLLEIFAFGTWRDYRENASSLPELNSAQATKLKQLSVITRASQSRVIPYTDLLTSLEIQTVHELEELIIDAIYSNILKAKLDQKYSQVEIENCIGRDVRLRIIEAPHGKEIEMRGQTRLKDDEMINSSLGNIVELRSKLQKWTDSVGGVLDQLDQYINGIQQQDTLTAEDELAHDELVRQALQKMPHSNSKDRKGKQKDTASQLASNKDDQMTVDESEEMATYSKTRKRTRA